MIAEMQARGVRVIARPFGLVILTRHEKQNTKAFREAAQEWFRTDDGQAWLRETNGGER